MNDMLVAVSEFHDASEEPKDLDSPGIVPYEIQVLRRRLIEEELDEYWKACCDGDPVEVLDALCDLAYVLMGTVIAHGMAGVFDRAFAEVHRSNMTKFPGGVVTRRADGKVIKPDSWTPPNLGQFV